MKKVTDSKIFAFTRWDALPVIAGVLHLCFIVSLFYLFPRTPLWVMLILGLIYSVSINWNINSISHNLIHNPYFRANWLNRLFCLVESLAIGFSQTMYDCVHQIHHRGNSDRPDANGNTVDWVSIYRHGKDGQPENVWSYTFLSFFRDEPKLIYQEIKRKNIWDARFALFEIFAFVSFYATMAYLNWRFVAYLLPFWYFGQSLSFLNGYYRHYGGNPDMPLAWGVSTYNSFYNWLFFNNGYHAEHHYRPKVHWTKMKELHESVKAEQRKVGTRVIHTWHMFGFLESAAAATPPSEELSKVANG